MIVDDEPMLRRTMSDRLGFWGCTTEEAATGEEALAILKERSFDLVMLDMIMPPGIDGVETGSRIRQLDPDVEIVFVTGYSDVPLEELQRRVDHRGPGPHGRRLRCLRK